jgi:EAL and modified HD-GYP domain-containing signal transduction protein
VRATATERPVRLFACNVETTDDLRFCRQWHYSNFHGKFASKASGTRSESGGDPHKSLLLNILRLVQGEAETAEIAAAMKQDPLLSFRILRYLNSPALGLSHRIDSLAQALVILGRQRLTRWLSVLLFSVREPQLGDWLLVENALTRGRLMEVLGEELMPGVAHDPLFLTGIFSCLGNLLHRPLAETLDDMLLADDIKNALLERSGPYAPLLAVAEACEDFDLARMKDTALAAGLAPNTVNRALLSATAWASEVTEYWE